MQQQVGQHKKDRIAQDYNGKSFLMLSHFFLSLARTQHTIFHNTVEDKGTV